MSASMSPAALFGVAFVGTLFWAISPEAAAAVFAVQHRWPPLAVGLVAAAGQTLALVALAAFGDQLRRRWRWFDRRCERVKARAGDRIARNSIVVAAASGLVGFPPISIVGTLAPALWPRARPLLMVMALMRLLRFSLVAVLALHSGLRWPW
jgi:membrane protein YqaA with SNARE-associated domain